LYFLKIFKLFYLSSILIIASEGSFFKRIFAPMGKVGAKPLLDLALFAPRRIVGAYASLKKTDLGAAAWRSGHCRNS
jgi:hypothetical protein